MTILDADFFARPTLDVASDLVGKLLVRELPTGERLVGRIVETEAYGVDDPACHAWTILQRGAANPDQRGLVLFEAPGTAYVYLNYGVYWLLNVVTEPAGYCGAVLIRAVEPIEGIETMRRNRPGVRRDRDLTSGPGRLTVAFGIDGTFNRTDLTCPPLYFAIPARAYEGPVAVSTRIGITKGAELPWRFFIEGNPYVSRGKPSGSGARS